ncbi:PHD FINGER FAMILY PROTEIN [Salix purpurea]|uniref:PHD FINGER FAMILY PROTEIN n=1 Tax=Salix purpurea TaxID=77065 RepID=A0A9Q0WF00_SALPP|nr:PHD FINGER FAMILY PROTEIN [Salix purpurea]
MESMEVKKRGRGRPKKRKLNEEEGEEKKSIANALKKQALDIRWKPLVGRYVLKEFDSGIFLGKIVCYDTGLYRVDYEDGDFEDLESGELREILLGDGDFDDELLFRRDKLDEYVLRKSEKRKKEVEKDAVDLKKEVIKVDPSASGGLMVENGEVQVDDVADSSSDSCECARDGELGMEMETPVIPPPQLPSSSGSIGVPDEYVSHLFSVYTFLRSFNIRLFLSPFTLDDLVGAVNCPAQNTLLDAIHVALMRALRRHLEALSLESSELATKCLRSVDWCFLDPLTWTVYLVHYFTIMGYVKGSEWKGFYDHIWKREYYSLPVGQKLMILQILCDDVLDSAEIRAEVDVREESEFGIDPDTVTANLPDNGPKRVHPRYSKTSACKDREAMNIIAESQDSKSFSNSMYLGSTGTERDGNVFDVDGNGDECRLCGLDGTLLCCDGCPSSYHSRCIGIVKMYIPEGPWYCPECTINKLGPTITMGTSLRGAEVFGIDLYEQVFLGTCDHLLVLKASTSGEPCFRYYNHMDIQKVLQALTESVQHRSLYLEICKAIAQHWDIPQNAFSLLETTGRGFNIASAEEDTKSSALSLPSCEESFNVAGNGVAQNAVSVNGSNTDIVAIPSLDTSLDATIQFVPQCIVSDGDVSRTGYFHMRMKPHEQIKLESTESVNQLADPSDLTQQSLVYRSSAIEIATCTSAISVGSRIENGNGTCLPASVFSQSKEGNQQGIERVQNSTNNCSYVATFFKPHAYINHYMHGEFAASAAANLSVLSSEESRTETYKSSNGRKVVSDILLQAKAFSIAASRFFWPSSERKLVEVPRERCGWCYSCKLPASNRRGCMLNSAALTATKGALKMISGLRPVLNGEGSLSSISTYILYMGEILCGLATGPFLSASHRKLWRKQVEDASTYSAIKLPLLELEKNIRLVALSGDWVKAMDDWLVESSVTQSSASSIGTAHRRRVNGKRHKKHSGVTDTTADGCHDKSFVWWRGGELLKLVFNKAILPKSMVRRAARQGGSRKISGIHYTDDSEIPNRSRQLVWRAAVERSNNASQLALQVRYLDFHVRWTDLVRPEQNLQDGKGSETEASVFRNAVICDKKIEEKKTRYGVAFRNQKHLPSRIMKNIIEIEQSENGKDKYWFSEMHVPLYLIKEFEESLDKVIPPPAKMPSNELSVLQRRQLKDSRRNIFSYLASKRDKLDSCSCASCQYDVLIRDTVTCSSCQGYCHQACTASSRIYTNEEAQFSIICKRCYSARAVIYDEKRNESLTSPLPLQWQEHHNTVTAMKNTRIKVHNQPFMSVRTQESCSEVKQSTYASSKATKTKSRTQVSCSEVKQAISSSRKATKTESRSRNCGIIWRKKNNEDTGIDFRHKNILSRGSPNGKRLMPECNLCRKEYNCDLMYIHCETCANWFHADAVELEESKLSDVIGFKCCKCRRIKSPNCPYRDGYGDEKTEVLKPRNRAWEQGIGAYSGTIAESRDCEPSTPLFPMENVYVQDDDPLLFSLSRVEQIAEQNSEVDFEWNIAGQGPQKLPVRRQGKRQGDAEDISVSNLYPTDSSMFLETNNSMNKEMSCAEWDVSGNGLDSEMVFDYEDVNYEDMAFEPQTYFSFTELLATDDGCQLDGIDATGAAVGNNENEFHAASEDEFQKQHTPGTSCDVPLESAPNTMPCKMCLDSVPSPDLSCDICGLVLHRYCSPWVECSPAEGSDIWRCGNCRKWQ